MSPATRHGFFMLYCAEVGERAQGAGSQREQETGTALVQNEWRVLSHKSGTNYMSNNPTITNSNISQNFKSI
jgi:hypothetical protein